MKVRKPQKNSLNLNYRLKQDWESNLRPRVNCCKIKLRPCQDHVCEVNVCPDHVCLDHVYQDHVCQEYVC